MTPRTKSIVSAVLSIGAVGLYVFPGLGSCESWFRDEYCALIYLTLLGGLLLYLISCITACGDDQECVGRCAKKAAELWLALSILFTACMFYVFIRGWSCALG
jgi:hypothetical protein